MRTKKELLTAIRRDRRVVLVVNAASRRSERAAARLPRLLESAGVPPVAEFRVTQPKRLPETLAEALETQPDLVLFGGGDGSMATAVNGLAHLDVALGVLPLGTTNNFARTLGLPLRLDLAVRTIGEGKVVDVDLGRVESGAEGKYFANLVSLGLSVEVARHAPHRLKRLLGRPAYALTALGALPRHEPFFAEVTAGGATQQLWTHQLNVANGSFHGGVVIAGDASVDDRLLAVYRLGDRRRPTVSVAMLGQLVGGPWRSLATDRYLTASEVRVETEPAMSVDVDGEVWGRTPVTVAIAPNALRVFAPVTFDDR